MVNRNVFINNMCLQLLHTLMYNDCSEILFFTKHSIKIIENKTIKKYNFIFKYISSINISKLISKLTLIILKFLIFIEMK